MRRNDLVKLGEFMENPEVDNHELSLGRNTFESATTNSIPLEQ